LSSSASRGAALPVLAAALGAAVLSLAVTGLLPVPFLPSAPPAFGRLLLAFLAAFLLAVVPAGRQGPWRAPTVLLGVLPCVVFAVTEGGLRSGIHVGWWAVLVLAAALAGTRARAAVAAALIVVLGGAAVLADAGLPLLPTGWNAVTQPTTTDRASNEATSPASGETAGPMGLRVGAPVRLAPVRAAALGLDAGPWWERAARARHPGPRPVILVLDGTPREAPARPAGAPSADVTVIRAGERPWTRTEDLLACDAILVRTAAWTEDDPRARAKARALAGFVRGGGLLIGPAPERPWPPELTRALRQAARGHETGPQGALRLGAGLVARAAAKADVDALLAGRAWVREVGTALLDVDGVPPWPAGLPRWCDRPLGRRTQGVLLWIHVLVLGVLLRLWRGGGAGALAALLVSAAVSAGIVWTSPQEAGYRVTALAIDIGGPGGRRLEAVVIDAGTGGYEGAVRFEGGGVLSVRGGRLTADGRLLVRPGHAAWVLRERRGLGVAGGGREDVAAAVLRPLLRGHVDPRRLRYGRLGRLPVRVGGVGPVEALTLTYRPPEE